MLSLSLAVSAAESSISAAGPVGLIAVTAGIGGLVYGLVRRRKAVPVAPQNQRVVSDVEQV